MIHDLAMPLPAIQKICNRYSVAELAVFGSAIRDDFRPDSDIDLLVTFHPEARIGLVAFVGLQQELSDLLQRPVDLVSKRGLKPVIRDEILASARVLYED